VALTVKNNPVLLSYMSEIAKTLEEMSDREMKKVGLLLINRIN